MPSYHAPIDRIVVAIPVKDEESRIQSALLALDRAAREVALPVSAVVLVNNSSDRTIARIDSIACSLSIGLHVQEVTLPPPLANAGGARRLAMEMAADRAPQGVLMTTDADSVVAPHWFRASLQGLATSELVCGAIDVEELPAEAAGCRIARIERKYGCIMHEIRYASDRLGGRQGGRTRPHYMESGATLAMRTSTYDAIGGLPPVGFGEDRALVHRVEAQGLRVRYCPAMRAAVSGRLDGRAVGGMAACLRARSLSPDPVADQAMLTRPHIESLWEAARDGQHVLWPDRSVPHGPAQRASDLERALPGLAVFLAEEVRPFMRSGLTDAT
ncbi:glycosyltransferase [Paracoccus rhizosphaerae]|uniref:Glycosyltransferase n=1 Tax=Paracoccus rhizosphaerae TaxID=1133347 RepID=A0ABV6CKE6_9RHOB|nr:glycosyltransferase family 2 protein [Paracoccus rhizosphaerae]